MRLVAPGNVCTLNLQKIANAATRPDVRERIRHPAGDDKACRRDLSPQPDGGTNLGVDRDISALQENLAFAKFRECPECTRENCGQDRTTPHLRR